MGRPLCHGSQSATVDISQVVPPESSARRPARQLRCQSKTCRQRQSQTHPALTLRAPRQGRFYARVSTAGPRETYRHRDFGFRTAALRGRLRRGAARSGTLHAYRAGEPTSTREQRASCIVHRASCIVQHPCRSHHCETARSRDPRSNSVFYVQREQNTPPSVG